MFLTSTATFALRNADIDGDGKRKELDRDNDYMTDIGSDDGCEDTNFDGKYQVALSETNTFSATDDIRLHIRLDWPLFGSDVDLHLIRPAVHILQRRYVLRQPQPGLGDSGEHLRRSAPGCGLHHNMYGGKTFGLASLRMAPIR